MTTSHELLRLDALHEYGVLDAPADDELEAVVRVAARVAGKPFATLNLIDENRQCHLTTAGFEGGISALGRLCIFDSVPGTLDEERIDRIKDLAGVILALFERRRQGRLNAELLAESERQHEALKQAHADLAQTNAELQRSNAELEQFAGVVSHDLAAPLGVVNGYLELLGDEQDEDSHARTWVLASTRAVARMQHLTNDLLTYAQAGSGPCRSTTADLGDLADQAVTDLRAAIDEADAEVIVPAGLPTVFGDATLIRQLLQNLIGNAVKYRHPERRPRVEVGAARADGGWISIRDNGRGIPAEHRARVFEMFTRVDRTPAGHGIGLSTCQRTAERHGGRIWAGGTAGGGTTVSFTVAGRVTCCAA